MTCRKAQLCGSIALGLYAAAMTIAGNAALAQDVPTATIYSSTKIGNTLSLPTDVGVGENGHIYVVDGGNHQVAVFDKTGQRVNTLGERGEENGQFESPVGLGIGRWRNLRRRQGQPAFTSIHKGWPPPKDDRAGGRRQPRRSC